MKIQGLFDLVHGIRDLYPDVEFEAIYGFGDYEDLHGNVFIGYRIYYKLHTVKVYTNSYDYRLHSKGLFAEHGDLDFILCSIIDLFEDTRYTHTYCTICG